MTSNVQYIVYSYLVLSDILTYFWLFLASYVAFGAHNLGRKEKKRRKKEDRFLYVGIVDKKSKRSWKSPSPPLSHSNLKPRSGLALVTFRYEGRTAETQQKNVFFPT